MIRRLLAAIPRMGCASVIQVTWALTAQRSVLGVGGVTNVRKSANVVLVPPATHSMVPVRMTVLQVLLDPIAVLFVRQEDMA